MKFVSTPQGVLLSLMVLAAGFLQLPVAVAAPTSVAERSMVSQHQAWLMAQDPAALQLYYRVAEDLRCPTCTGLSVLQSDAPFSEQIKTRLQELIDGGDTEAQIRAFFVERYGLWILRTPPKQGMHLTLWLIPLLFGLIGVWGGLRLLRQPDQMPAAELWSARLEDEVARRLSKHTAEPRGGQG